MTNLVHMRLWSRRELSPALLALPALILTVVVGAGTQAPRFLQDRLGPPMEHAPLVRQPAPGLRVQLQEDGYAVQHGDARLRLRSAAGDEWMRYARGVERATPFGRETIVVDGRTTEQFLTVERHQDERTWRWQLETGGLLPRVNPDGSVAFHDGALADLAIDPPRIVTPSGADVTPHGLRWSLSRSNGSWWLALPLDDRDLPLPYVIDPAITLRAAATSANNGGGAASVTVNRPGGVIAGDFLLAMVNARGGTSRVITAPAGWTLVRRDNNSTNVAQAVYRKLATGSEPLSYTWTFNASVKATGGIVPYVGVDSAAPIDVSSSNVNVSNSSSATALSVTTTATNHRLVGFYGISDDRTWSPPAGMTERWDARAGGGASSIASEAADVTQVAAAASGNKTATASGGGLWVAQLVALRVDATAPPVPVQAIAESAADTHVVGSNLFYRPTGAGGTFTVSSAASDPGSGVAMVSFPGLTAGFTPTTSTDDTTAPYTQTYAWTTGGAESGPQTVTVTDRAGNETDGVFTITPDASAPSTTDDTAAIGSAWRNTDETVTLTPTDVGAGVVATHYTIDGTNPTALSPQGTSVVVSGEGVHTVKYFSRDAVSNDEAVQTAATTIRIDTTAPTSATLDPLPATISEPQTLSGSGSDALSGIDSIAYFYCAGPPCVPSTFIGAGSTAPGYSFSWADQPPDGNYAVAARAFDAAGNSFDSATQTVTIDNAPDAIVDSGPSDPTNSTGATFTFSANEAPVTFECQLDGAGFAPCTTPQSYAGLSDGAHVFQVRATDGLGNAGTAATYPWIIDRAEPSTTVDTGPANPTNATSATFTFSSSELGSTFECRLDAGAYAPCASPELYTGLAAGSHTFEVRATDPAGNLDASPASYTWSIDTTGPTSTIDTGPADPTNSTAATFTFSANELGSTFECQLDGGGYSPCTTPKTYTGLGAGPHTFQVRATDPVGNTGSAASDGWTIDLTAPDTSVTSGPPDPSGSTSATFTFSATEPGSTFECQVDGAGYAACTSPKSYTGLGDGSHTFNVRATDQAGNTDGTPGAQTWTIDLGAPTATIDSGPPDPTNSTAATFTFSASEPGSTFECQLDGGAYSACTTPKTYTGLTEGTHTVRVRATDGVGNTGAPAADTWVIDLTSPTSTVDSGPSNPTNSTSAMLTFSADEPGVSFQCRIDGGGFAACTSPRAYVGLAEGTHTFEVRATDPAGNTGSAASRSWTIDTTTPDTTIGSGPTNPSGSASSTFTFSASEPGSSFACQLDGGGFVACTSPRTYTGLGAGSHTFDVRATDPAGNTDATPASMNWSIDFGPPTATVDSGPADPTGSTSATFTFSASEPGSTFECQLDAGLYAPCATPTTYAGLTEGAHTFRVRAIDGVGNVGPAAVHTWRVDVTAPGSTVDTGPAALTNSTGATFTFSASEGGASFECRLDGGGFAACTSPHSYAGVAEGAHTFHVRASDALGNVGAPATLSWTVDTTAPTASLTPPAANLSGAIVISASAADANGVASVSFERSPAGAGIWSTVNTDGSAPFTADLVTQIMADGFHDLRVVATDQAGNSAVSPLLSRRVDNTAPTAAVAVSHFLARSPVTLAATASDDGSGVASVSFERSLRGSGAWTGIGTASSAPYLTSFDPAGLTEGQYDLRAVVMDAAGNTARASTSVGVATSGLSVSLGTLGAVLTGSVAVNASTGGIGATQVAFEIKRAATGTWMLIAVDNAPPWNATVDTSVLRDARYDLRATVFDPDGVSASDLRSGITIDNTAPSLVSSSPAQGAALAAGKPIILTADETLARVTGLTLDGSARPVSVTATTATITTGRLAVGAHTLTGRLMDEAGLSAPFTLRFTVAAPPRLTVRLGSPARKASRVAVPVTLSQSATIVGRLLSPTGKTVTSRRLRAAKGTTRLALGFPRTARAGRYTIVVRATAAGKTAAGTIRFAVRARNSGGSWIIVGP